MDRRLFVKLSALSVSALTVGLLEGCRFRKINSAVSSPDLLSHMLDKETLMNIGKKYLSATPGEADEDQLMSALFAGSRVDDSSDRNTIHSFLSEKITHNFTEGETIIVDGWILSVTEARQCALFYLSNK